MTSRRPLSGLVAVSTTPRPSILIDDVDRRLLALLAKDARVSQRGLARQLRMSPPAIGERIARLENAGVIRGYSVEIDWSALGYITVYLAVTALQGAEQAAIMVELDRLPEVEETVVITGSIDMLARVRVRDHMHLRQFLLEQVWQIDGVQRTETFLSLAEMPSKNFAAALLGAADDAAVPATTQPDSARSPRRAASVKSPTRPG